MHASMEKHPCAHVEMPTIAVRGSTQRLRDKTDVQLYWLILDISVMHSWQLLLSSASNDNIYLFQFQYHRKLGKTAQQNQVDKNGEPIIKEKFIPAKEDA